MKQQHLRYPLYH